MEAETASNVKAELGEGPSWDERSQILYWVDIKRGQIHAHKPGNTSDELVADLGEIVTCVAPRKRGGLALTLRNGFYALDLGTKKLEPLYENVESPDAGARFNDGKVDPAGRFWAGTMDDSEKNQIGSLYFLGKDRKLKKVLSDIWISNGLGWTPDSKIMFYIDTPTRQVWSFDYSIQTGEISNRKIAADFMENHQKGDPDGMTVDAEGMIWVAHWGGACVTRWNPVTGKLLDTVALPTDHVTSVCFGGRNLDELYITSAQEGLDEKARAAQPLAGRLFVARVGVRGLPTFAYEG